MKTDERLKTLCEEFAGLEEAEKDYILGVSRTLIFPVPAKSGNTRKSTVLPAVEAGKQRGYNRPLGGVL